MRVSPPLTRLYLTAYLPGGERSSLGRGSAAGVHQRLMGIGPWECPFVAENANVGATGRLACCSARATSSASAAEKRRATALGSRSISRTRSPGRRMSTARSQVRATTGLGPPSSTPTCPTKRPGRGRGSGLPRGRTCRSVTVSAQLGGDHLVARAQTRHCELGDLRHELDRAGADVEAEAPKCLPRYTPPEW